MGEALHTRRGVLGEVAAVEREKPSAMAASKRQRHPTTSDPPTADAHVAPPSGAAWRALGLPVLLSGMSVSCATACTNPLDVLKVRLQVVRPTHARSGGPVHHAPSGMADAFVQLVRHEGPLALWKGLTPSLVRAMCYGGLRLGLYQPILDALQSSVVPGGSVRGGQGTERDGGGGRTADLSMKVAAGCASGSFAAALLNPTELVKTRLMADARAGTSTTATAAAPRGAAATLTAIVRAEGVGALWKGASMSMTRSAVLTASQCATYDEVKRLFMAATGATDGLGTHLCASMLTGLVTTTVTNPVDMIKTQLYMDKGGSAGGASGAMRMVLERHGPMGLMRGWSANYVRLGPQTVVTFIALERFRALAGMEAL